MSPSNRFRVFGVTPHFAGKHVVSYLYCRCVGSLPISMANPGGGARWPLQLTASKMLGNLKAVRLQALCRIAFMLSRTGVVRGMQLVPGSSAEQSWLGLVG